MEQNKKDYFDQRMSCKQHVKHLFDGPNTQQMALQEPPHIEWLFTPFQTPIEVFWFLHHKIMGAQFFATLSFNVWLHVYCQ